MTAAMPTLLAAIQGLDPFLRAHIASVRITTGPSGYKAWLSIEHWGPAPLDLKTGIESQFAGIALLGGSRHPDVELTLDWRMAIWDQILQLVHDPALSRPDELGSMEAAELSKDEPDGTVSQREARKTWIVKTHNTRKERNDWLARCISYSATVRSPAE